MKLSYIAWGKYLAAGKDYGLSIEEVQAWKYGPVIPPIWHEYKKYFLYGSIPITDKIREKRFNLKNRNDNDFYLWQLVIDVCDEYKDKNADDMVEITHGKDTPWDEQEPKLLEGQRGVIIPQDRIKNYFLENKVVNKKSNVKQH